MNGFVRRKYLALETFITNKEPMRKTNKKMN